MRLRNRGIGIGETFYPFKRLPIEIRQMIWRYILKARVVEVLWATLDGEKAVIPSNQDLLGLEGFPSADEIVFMSLSKLPIALQVNKDSRNAILFFYPLCFTTGSHDPRIRFNFSLDTLYLDNKVTQYSFDLFKNFNTTEKSKLENLAVMEMYGINDQGSGVWDANWGALGIEMNKLAGVKELFHVIDATKNRPVRDKQPHLDLLLLLSSRSAPLLTTTSILEYVSGNQPKYSSELQE
ncbi:uncharacterized protein PAC_04076 [Phialocephala subalpina]|uniref:2EXR domain-containing protein n=1 Tax=Phialocephala subalpina TaxID=576137 RepID=A0A1L7WN54_9HELO|nr:uncharacterized protein PAC_04076 [Phialocephala subalpina]